MERRIEEAAAPSSTGQGVHSSSTMAMSAPKRRWISTARSGVSAWRVPSMWERKVTPSSSISRRPASDMTWKPPESVRIGPGQFMKP